MVVHNVVYKSLISSKLSFEISFLRLRTDQARLMLIVRTLISILEKQALSKNIRI